MNAVDDYLRELGAALNVRGRARRRLLAETRDHLIDSAAEYGELEAVRRFGSAAELAAAVDLETAHRRGLAATAASAAATVLVGCSTLALINGVGTEATAALPWAVAFFASAQVAIVAVALSVLRAAASWKAAATLGRIALLTRTNLVALIASLVTLVAAGGAVPGQASVWALLAGPMCAAAALVVVLRARALRRRIQPDAPRLVREPLDDLLDVMPVRTPMTVRPVRSPHVLGPIVLAAALAAFCWDHLDGGSWATSSATAATESAFVLLGFVLLGSALGLRPGRRPPSGVH